MMSNINFHCMLPKTIAKPGFDLDLLIHYLKTNVGKES